MTDSTAKPAGDKPKLGKMWLHPSGRWCRKHRGRFYYFGKSAAEAVRRYAVEWPYIEQGLPLPDMAPGVTLRQLCNKFLALQSKRWEQGEIARPTLTLYYRTAKRLTGILGDNRRVESIRPDVLTKLRDTVIAQYSESTAAAELTRMRGLFRTAEDHDWCKPLKYRLLRAPSKRAAKRNGNGGSHDEGPRTWTPEEVEKILNTANPTVRAMFLIALNAAFGNHDVGSLPQSALEITDRENAWVCHDRPKTGEPRRAALWPRTVDALRQAIESRPKPKLPEFADRVFLTRSGNPWVRQQDKSWVDGIATYLPRWLENAGVDAAGRGFYTNRHTAATHMGDRDLAAVRCVLGHRDPTMLGRYQHFMEEPDRDARLRTVADRVHHAMFSCPAWPDPGPAAD